MATAGSGDVLTGMVAGLVAAHDEERMLYATVCAVWLHSRAGDIAVESGGVNSMTSSDIIDAIPAAFESIAE
jgi:NAD(P)H-hydrate epimerase